MEYKNGQLFWNCFKDKHNDDLKKVANFAALLRDVKNIFKGFDIYHEIKNSLLSENELHFLVPKNPHILSIQI